MLLQKHSMQQNPYLKVSLVRNYLVSCIIKLGFALQRGVVYLPFKPCMRIARYLGAMYGACNARCKTGRITRINIAACAPTLAPNTPEENILKAYHHASGQALIETSFAWWASDYRIKTLLHAVSGLSILNAAIAEKKGVIICANHVTHLYLLARFVAQFTPHMHSIVPFRRHPVLQRTLTRAYQTIAANTYPQQGSMRPILKALRSGEVFFYPADVNVRQYASVFTDFLGVNTLYSTVPARLSAMTGAKVLLAHCEFMPDNYQYHLNFESISPTFYTSDTSAATSVLAKQQQTLVMNQPERYYFAYQKFKYRPPGETPMYPFAPSISKKLFFHEVQKSHILQGTPILPKIIRRQDGMMMKCFYRKSFWSKDKQRIRPLFFLQPYAKQFVSHAKILLERGFLAPNVLDFYKVKKMHCQVVHYAEIQGEDLRRKLAGTADKVLLEQFIRYVAALHEAGIFFRGLLLANVLITPDEQFAAIDVSDCHFTQHALPVKKRIRNLKHILNDRRDKHVFSQIDMNALLEQYCQASTLGENEKEILCLACGE